MSGRTTINKRDTDERRFSQIFICVHPRPIFVGDDMSAGSTPSMKTTLIFSAPLRLCVKLFSKEEPSDYGIRITEYGY